MFLSLITNKIILSAFFASISSQSVKAILAWRNNHGFHWRYLFIAAGMPSSHTATVTALSLSVFFIDGLSTLFMAVLVFSAIVVRDVLGDKVFAQKQEEAVNNTIRKIYQGEFENIKWDDLIGHTTKEVVAGFTLGIAVASVIFLI